MYPIPPFQSSDFMIRLLSTYPGPWTSDAAKLPKGVLYSLLDSAYAYDLSIVNGQVIYAQLLTRIKTAINGGLDTISNDFFGTGLPRLPGESDASFRARILAALLQPRVTRAAISAAIASLTGAAPRMIEPWNTGDTCAWDANSYWDTDDATFPFRWGGPVPYQGFVLAQEPLYNVTGGGPISCWDVSFYWDTAGSYWLDQTVEQAQTNIGALASLITAFKAEGTLVWVAAVPTPTFQTNGYTGVLAGATAATLALNSPQFPYIKGFMPLIGAESPSWMSNVWCANKLDFPPTVNFDNLPAQPQSLGWVAQSAMQYGFMRVPVAEGQGSITLPWSDFFEFVPGFGVSLYPHCFPNWNTTVALTGLGSEFHPNIEFTFGAAAPTGGYIDVMFLQSLPDFTFNLSDTDFETSDQPPVNSGDTSYLISTNINLPYKVFIGTSWQTQIQVNKLNGMIQVTFGTACPDDDEFIYWAIQEG